MDGAVAVLAQQLVERTRTALVVADQKMRPEPVDRKHFLANQQILLEKLANKYGYKKRSYKFAKYNSHESTARTIYLLFGRRNGLVEL